MISYTFTPEEIECFADRTKDKNPLHRRNNEHELGQIVMGTHLISQRMENIRRTSKKGLKILNEENSRLTRLDAKFNYFIKANQRIEWEKLNIRKKDELSITTRGYIKMKDESRNLAIELSIRMSSGYKTPKDLGKIFLRNSFTLNEQDILEPEFPILLIPPALVMWKKNQIGSYSGINLRTENEFHNNVKKGKLIIEIGAPKKIRKPRTPTLKNPFPNIYFFPTQTRQGDEIISTGNIKVASAEYLSDKQFIPID